MCLGEVWLSRRWLWGRGVAGGMLSIFWGGGVGGGGLGWRVALPEPRVVLAGRREGFHGDPAGSAIPGLQITPNRSAQGFPLRVGMHSWQIGRREIWCCPPFKREHRQSFPKTGFAQAHKDPSFSQSHDSLSLLSPHPSPPFLFQHLKEEQRGMKVIKNCYKMFNIYKSSLQLQHCLLPFPRKD